MGIEAGDPASVRQLVTRLGSGSKMRCKLCRASLQKSRASQLSKASCSGSPKGCGLTSIRKAGYTATKARAAGFTLAEIEDAGYVEGLLWQRDTQHRRRRRLGIQAARRKLLAL